MVAIKTGPLTRDEIMLLWRSVTDAEYHNPLLEKDDSNIEIIEQAAEQFANVSKQIDDNTQGLFILPWSGQTAPPSSGAGNARTTLTVERTGLFDLPLFFKPGDVIIQHRLNDYGPEGPIDVTTNRTYAVELPAAFGVGERGPIELQVVATNVGPGYNFPTEGTLNTIVQPGVGFSNSSATVVNNPGGTNRVVAANFPDVPITGHIGQYLLFTAGANQGQYRRITGVENPNPDAVVPHGGVFNVAAEWVLAVATVVGSFAIGEVVTQPATGAEGSFISLFDGRMVLVRIGGTFNDTDPIQGEFGGTATTTAVEQQADLVEEVATAYWEVVSWREGLTVTITNPEQPTGGQCGFLDELGNERGLPRFNGEGDEDYRRRISTPADVVSPAAVIRAGNGVLEPLGEGVCLREVGRPLFQGMFFDDLDLPYADEPWAYDLDLVEMTMLGGNQQGQDFAFFDGHPSGFFDDPSPQTNTNFFSLNSDDPSFGLVLGTSSFIPCEIVTSTDSSGAITQGIAHFDYPVSSLTLPAPDNRSLQGSPVFRGVTRVNGPGFEAGAILRGTVSGYQQQMLTVGPGLLPQYRFNAMLSLRESRGFFLVGVPRVALDDFGIFYDEGADNAFDANNIDNFFDGAAIGSDSLYARVHGAVDNVRPAGVPFALYIEDIGCI